MSRPWGLDTLAAASGEPEHRLVRYSEAGLADLREDLLRHLAEPDAAPSATVGEANATVMFTDLVSFTPLTRPWAISPRPPCSADSVRWCATVPVGTGGG